MRHYTNATAIVTASFRDTEDLDGLFSGWDGKKGEDEPKSWQYKDAAFELLAAYWLDQAANKVAQVGKPLHEGVSGDLWKASKVAGVVGLLLALLPGNGWPKRLAAALCTIAASLLLRYAMLMAGKVSARDPHATFMQQRARKL